MIASLRDFTPKDYEKVMAEVNKAHIELVDKLSKEDMDVGKAKSSNNKPTTLQTAHEKSAAQANFIIAQSHEEDLKPITISTGDSLDEPTGHFG